MAEVKLKGNPIKTIGDLPKKGSKAPDFTLVDEHLKDHHLSEFKGKKKVIATVPSLDTGTCSKMTKHFNDMAAAFPDVIFITVSADLPFAQKRFCQAEGVKKVLTLSTMRNQDFGKNYGLLITTGPIAGILARSVLVLDENDEVLYSELVSEISEEPNYKIESFLGI